MKNPIFTELLGSIPDVLPGEPPNPRSLGLGLGGQVLVRSVLVLILFQVLLPLWIPYLLLVLVYGWPPNVPRLAQIGRFLKAAWTENPPPPGLSVGWRAWLTLAVLRKGAVVPFWGLAWLIDEVLYGQKLNAIPVEKPLFEISAGRSGSTQLARYIEEDSNLAAPSLLQSIFPYRWLWHLVAATVGRVVSKEWVTAQATKMLPPAFLERHEADPFRTDTFEGAVMVAHLNHLGLFFGPQFATTEMIPCHLDDKTRPFWEVDFVDFLARLGQKILLDAGPGHRLFVKGHFLVSAPALARRFPDARFLTMIRMPDKRLQSGINYLRVNPFDPVLGAPPWDWLSEAITQTELAYCKNELAWFTRQEGPHRLVVRFDDYVRDLGGTVDRIYDQLLEMPVPPHIPRTHTERRRHSYLVDRSLEQLGIDGGRFLEAMPEYVAWCKNR